MEILNLDDSANVRKGVYYEDYNEYLDTIENLFTSSSGLVSRNPESMIEEVVSSYCPQCLSRYMEDEVKEVRNRCPKCFECPKCQCVLLERTIKKELKLHCGYCEWNINKPSSIQSPLNVIQDEGYKLLLDAHIKNHVLSKKRLQHGILPLKKRDKINDINTIGRWSVSDIDKIVNETNELSMSNPDPKLKSLLYQYLETQPSIDKSMRENIYPLGILLRTKRTLRCRKDYDDGKMSILVQPKTYPLEGDSSMNLQRGRWFIKDASAVHTVPRILIVSPISTENDKMIINLFNPLEENVHIKFEPILQRIQPKKNLILSDSDKVKEYKLKSISSSIELGGYEDPLLRDDEISSDGFDKINARIDNEYEIKICGNEAMITLPLATATATGDENEAVVKILGIKFNYSIADSEEITSYSVLLIM